MKKVSSSILWGVLTAVAFCVVFHERETVPKVEAQTTLAPAPDVEALRESIRNFFENLSDPNKGSAAAVEDFLKNSAMSEVGKTKLIEGLKKINGTLGAYVAYEPIGFKTLGNDLVVFRYLYKCQDYPIVWYFTYYRPRAKSGDAAANWNLIGFRYDSNLDAALLDATF